MTSCPPVRAKGRPLSLLGRAALHATMLALLLAALVVPAALAQSRSAKPRVPPGLDAGGAAVALVGPGIDYTAPDLARRLARDGEGDLVGWDFLDRDGRPYEAAAGAGSQSGTALARALLAEPGVGRIVVVRTGQADPLDLGRLVVFLSRSPARVALLTVSTLRAEDWTAFNQAASHFPALLFVVPAGDEGADLEATPAYPIALGLPNVIVVTAADAAGRLAGAANRGARLVDVAVALSPPQAVAPAGVPASEPPASRRAAAHLAGLAVRLAAEHPGLDGAALKARLAGLAKPMPAAVGARAVRSGWISAAALAATR